MEPLTKIELRALLEFIKESYPICDIEPFRQRVVSRLSKIVPPEIVSHSAVKSRMAHNAFATYPAHGHTQHGKKLFAHHVHDHPIIIQHAKTHDTKALKVAGVLKRSLFRRLIRGSKHERLFLNLLSHHVNRAYRNARTVTRMQQKLTLVDRALYRLNLGLIFLTPDGKIRLATTWAMQQLMSYLGPQSLQENRLPKPLWMWVKQWNVALKGSDDILLQPKPLVLTHEGKRLVIRLVSDLDQSLLVLEEHPSTTQLQLLASFGLSPREAQVLTWTAQGKTNKEMGLILKLSPRTVQKHLEHIYQKIGVESRTAAAAKAYEMTSLAVNQTIN